VHHAEADEGQAEVGEGGEIAGGADRALARDHGIKTPVQHLDQSTHDLGPHPRVTAREGVDLEGEDEAHGVVV